MKKIIIQEMGMSGRWLIAFVFSISCILVTTVSFAQNTRSVFLSYSGSAGGLQVGSAEISVKINPHGFGMGLKGGSSGIIGAIIGWSADTKIQGYFANGFAIPHKVAVTVRKNKGRRDINIDFANGMPTASVVPHKDLRAGEEANPAHMQNSIDPGTMIMRVAQQVTATQRCEGQYRVFDGRSVFDIQMVTLGNENVSSKGYQGTALKCRLNPTPLSGRVMRPVTHRSVMPVDFWMAEVFQGETWVPVRFRSQLSGFGVKMDLRSASIQ